MKIIYDSYADVINITFREGKVDKTIEIAPEINKKVTIIKICFFF